MPDYFNLDGTEAETEKASVKAPPLAPGEDPGGDYYVNVHGDGGGERSIGRTPPPGAGSEPDKETSVGHKIAVTAEAPAEGVANLLATPYNLTAALYNRIIPQGYPMPAEGGMPVPFDKFPTMDIVRDFSEDNPNAGPLGVLAQPKNDVERVLSKTGQAVGAAAAGGGLFGGAGGALAMGTFAAAPASLIAAQDEVIPEFAQDHPVLHFGEELGLNALVGTPQGVWHAISPLSTENAVRRAMGDISMRSGIPATELASAADAAKNTGLTLSQAAGKAGIANAGKLRTLEDSVGVTQPPAANEASQVLKKLPTASPTTPAPAPAPLYGSGDIPTQQAPRASFDHPVNENLDNLNNFTSRVDQLTAANDGLTRAQLSKDLTTEWNGRSPTFQNAVIQRVLNLGDDRAFMTKWESLPAFMQQSIIKSRPDVGDRLADIASRTRAINPTPLPMNPLPPTPPWQAALKATIAASVAAHSPQTYMAMHFLNAPNWSKTSRSALDARIERSLRESDGYLKNYDWLEPRPTPLGRIISTPTAAGALGSLGVSPQPGSQ